MSSRTIALGQQLYAYLLNVSLREAPLLRELREETARLPEANMQISPEQGQFMQLLVRLLGVRRALEIGTFTGYSALCVAQALAEGGELIACDVSAEWTAVARRYWQRAGVADRITLRLGPACDTLAQLHHHPGEGTFDFVFIDADKTNYSHYYENALTLLRPGGLIALDNTLWGGAVADPAVHDDSTEAIRQLNDRLHGDTRVDLSLVPIGDGLTLTRKRPA